MAAKYLISNIDLILVRKAVHFFTVDDGDDAIRQGSNNQLIDIFGWNANVWLGLRLMF